MLLIFMLGTVFYDEPTFWAVVGAAGGVYLFIHGFGILQRKRLILNTPESKIRSASMGLVEISGQAVGPYTISAPASELECFYHHTMAWELKQSGKNKEWVKVAEESLHVPFYIDDGTGRLMIDCNGAETDLHRDFHEEYRHSLFSADDPVPDGIRHFLARHGVASDRELKVDEYCIKPKNFLFVLGTLGENPGLELTSTPQQTQLAGKSVTLHLPSGDGVTRTVSLSVGMPQNSPLQISSTKIVTSRTITTTVEHSRSNGVDEQVIANALMKAGITNPEAWAAAGISNPAAARAQVAQIQPGSLAGTAAAPALDPAQRAGSAPTPDFDPHPKTVLMRGENDRAFFISWRSQKEVVASLGWKSALYIWSGPLLLLLSAYVLMLKLGWL